MSFTGDVKNEICEAALPSERSEIFRRGVLYGLKDGKPSLTTELPSVRDRLSAAFGDSVSVLTRNRNETTFFVLRFARDTGESAFPDGGDFAGGDDFSTGFFLRGLFLSCGAVSVQKAGYHLELSLDTEEKSSRPSPGSGSSTRPKPISTISARRPASPDSLLQSCSSARPWT